VLHDLHESPLPHDNTVGDGPYNAWVDPVLVDEWQMIGARNVADMTRFGCRRLHPTAISTLVPGYLMFLGAMHNGISRLYETLATARPTRANARCKPDEYARTWFKPNPPFPKALWSQRNNNNYEETGLLTSLHFFNENKRLSLRIST